MGLDMYLYPVDKVPKNIEEAEKLMGNRFGEVAYWRKTNFIHNWLMSHGTTWGKDDQFAYISRKKLKELLTCCFAVYIDHSLASKFLPTRDGYYFGSIKYDDGYFRELSRTIRILMDILENPEYSNHFVYYASW